MAQGDVAHAALRTRRLVPRRAHTLLAVGAGGLAFIYVGWAVTAVSALYQ